MLRYFRWLEDRCQELGNYRRKYLLAIDRYGRLLRDRLEAAGVLDRVHLTQAAADLESEMDAVLGAGTSEREKLDLLGCYFGIQFLHMNLRSLDFLRSRSPGAKDRIPLYQEFLRKAQEEFGELIRHYLRRLLDLFLGEGQRSEFAICTVGTRLHQDDVDMGIIDDGGPQRERLNRAIGRMAQEMTRSSSIPDFYLSEHIGGLGYSVSIAEYRERLDSRILDFVSVTELLCAHPLVGSPRLFNSFRREVLSRYYHRRGSESREHEGYLRGLLGEIESLLLWPKDRRVVNPKDDLLRLVSSSICAYRAVLRIEDSDSWEAFRRLGARAGREGSLFRRLERHYTFVEIFRHLYQQFGTQKETVELADPKEKDVLRRVAEAMGYEDVGVITATDQLMVHYTEHVREGRGIVEDLVPRVRDHLRKVTVLDDWLRLLQSPAPGGESRGLMGALLRKVRYFDGIKFWHDILDELEREENGFLVALIEDLSAEEPQERMQSLRLLSQWGHQTFFTMLRLITIFGRLEMRRGRRGLLEELNSAFLGTIQGTADEIRRFSTVFMNYPSLVHEYLKMVDERTYEILRERLSGDLWDSEAAAWQQRLIDLLDVYRKSSRLFRRVVDRVCQLTPDCLLYLSNREKLASVARGALADLVRHSAPAERRVGLRAYHDIQLLRSGLDILAGLPPERDPELAEFSDHYLQILFDICKAEEDAALGRRFHTHDQLAIFVAGSHARGRVHQDDYDLVALLNSTSIEIQDYANRVLSRLNREVGARGIVAQYRFADVFGTYVTPFDELRDYIKSARKEAFIEMSQLLGARMVVGSSRLEGEFRHQIVEDCIWAHKEEYLEGVLDEIRSRRRHRAQRDLQRCYDVKECPGGLRDLELAMLFWAAQHEAPDLPGPQLLRMLLEAMPEREDAFLDLIRSYQFLSHIRDVYRLSVGPTDVLEPDQLERPARILGYVAEGSLGPAERLEADLKMHLTRTAERIGQLLGLEAPA